MIWLVSITLFFAMLDLYFAELSILLTICLGAGIAVITGILLAWSLKTLRLAKQLPDKHSEEDIRSGRKIRKWFLVILIVEIAGINIATAILLKLNCFQYIVPVDILIVALHLLPLGRIFVMPVYYFLGVMVSLVDLLTMGFVPPSFQIGNLTAIIAIPSLSFVFLNWIVIVYVLKDGMKYLRKTQRM